MNSPFLFLGSSEGVRALLCPGLGVGAGGGMHNEDQCRLEKRLQTSPAHLPVQVPCLLVECSSTRLHPARRHSVTNLLPHAPQSVNLCVAKSHGKCILIITWGRFSVPKLV